MKYSLIAIAAATALLLAGCSASAPDTDADAEGAIATESLGDAVERHLEGTGVPGGAVLLLDSDGTQALDVFGEAAEGRTVQSDTEFMYRSITKSFVGTVILQLVEEGELSLGDSLSDYVDGVPAGEEITIEDLATMRSGIANYSASAGLGEALSADPTREPSVEDLLALAIPDSPVFAPGSAYEYSNTNTLLLGEIIEAVTGNPWFEEVDRRILSPLELDSVSYGTAEDSESAAVGFQLISDETAETSPPDVVIAEQLPWVAPGWFGAAGALAGSVDDLATWGEALGTGSLLRPETQELRLSLLGSTADDEASPEYDRYGFAIGEIDGWIGHTGNGLGYQSLTMHDPESGRTVAILINGTGDDQDLPAHLFRDLLRTTL